MTMEIVEAPPMPDLTPAHPVYGTCPRCIKAVGVLKSGHLKEHKTPELVRSESWKAVYRCPGSGGRYAEYSKAPGTWGPGTWGKVWDLAAGQWLDLPIQVPVLVVADPRLDGSFPQWRMAEVHSTPAARIGSQRLAAHDRWRIQLYCTEQQATVALIEFENNTVIGAAAKETARRDGFEAMARLVSKMIARMMITEGSGVQH